jgi:hypothetical protein
MGIEWYEEPEHVTRVRLLIDRYCADIVGESKVTCDLEYGSYLLFGPRLDDDMDDAEVLARRILYSTKTEITPENVKEIV